MLQHPVAMFVLQRGRGSGLSKRLALETGKLRHASLGPALFYVRGEGVLRLRTQRCAFFSFSFFGRGKLAFSWRDLPLRNLVLGNGEEKQEAPPEGGLSALTLKRW